YPGDVRSWLSRAWIYHDRENLDKAIADYTAALNLEPKNVEALRGRAEACFGSGQVKEALDDVKEAIRLAPNDRNLGNLLSRIEKANRPKVAKPDAAK